MRIEELKDDLPVPYHHTMDIIDSSKVQSFMDCPRGFFFRYVLGWTQEESNVHLVFGSAWHEAMEHIYINGLTNDVAIEAYEKFMSIYREGFPNDMTDESRAPKDPGTALKGLARYVQEYKHLDKYEVLHTEVAATVPIREDRLIHTKTDVILRDEDGIWSHEHKTTGRNSGPWRDKWHLIIQVGSYSHLLFTAFPNEQVQGVKINGAIFTKSRGAEFLRIPVRKTATDMQEYLWEVNHWIDVMEWNYQQLAESSPDDDVMTCFPKNSQSCSKFGCRYNGLCSAWKNPLKNIDRMPPGMKKEFWDPRMVEEEANNIATVDESGEVVITKKEKTATTKSYDDE